MIIRMAVGALLEGQTAFRQTRFMAVFAGHETVFSAQRIAGFVMIKFCFGDLLPAAGRVAGSAVLAKAV